MRAGGCAVIFTPAEAAEFLRDTDRPCRHEESLHGRCVACGRTWEEQARDRAERSRQ